MTNVVISCIHCPASLVPPTGNSMNEDCHQHSAAKYTTLWGQLGSKNPALSPHPYPSTMKNINWVNISSYGSSSHYLDPISQPWYFPGTGGGGGGGVGGHSEGHTPTLSLTIQGVGDSGYKWLVPIQFCDIKKKE